MKDMKIRIATFLENFPLKSRGIKKLLQDMKEDMESNENIGVFLGHEKSVNNVVFKICTLVNLMAEITSSTLR
jgi:hypothetical protein